VAGVETQPAHLLAESEPRHAKRIRNARAVAVEARQRLLNGLDLYSVDPGS
jgi:hypothetical protein